MFKYSRFNLGNSVICTMKSNYGIVSTLYSLGTWFVSGICRLRCAVLTAVFWVVTPDSKMLRCYPKSTLHSMLPMLSSQHQIPTVHPNTALLSLPNFVIMLPSEHKTQPRRSASFPAASSQQPNYQHPTFHAPQRSTLPFTYLYHKD